MSGFLLFLWRNILIFRLTGHCSLDNDGVGGLSRHCEVHNAQQRSPLPATSSHWQRNTSPLPATSSHWQRNTSPLPATSSHEQRRTADPHPQQQKNGRIFCTRPNLTILSLRLRKFDCKRGAHTFHTFYVYLSLVGFD